ncbi:MAG: bifunctional phosphoserine phosphatase/homoserine phosphotransferase ThrH [Fibrobacterota bacterium]|nr:bifunctional phosphoserine phosphatase/homoserine phosphotransferase ThrH [Fibrobacterota bacterium]
MKVVCLDMEGVLTPEIWQHVARRTKIDELNLTTRDVKDYRELMDRRLDICEKHGVTLENIQTYISELEVFEGARDLIDWIRERYQLIILSDTFAEFADHFMKMLGRPSLFCHNIAYNPATKRLEYILRQDNAKAMAVRAMRSLNLRTLAAGDSYNDIHMLKEADAATFFRAPANIREEFPQYGNLHEFKDLKEFISNSL